MTPPTTEHLYAWANEYADAVARTYDPDCIILFGSVARGTATPDSDIDVVIVGGNLPDDFRSRFRLLMRLRPRLAPLQVHTYTWAEWEQMMDVQHVTTLEALHDGIALHGQDRFATWRRTFDHWLALGLRRTACTWEIPAALAAD